MSLKFHPKIFFGSRSKKKIWGQNSKKSQKISHKKKTLWSNPPDERKKTYIIFGHFWDFPTKKKEKATHVSLKKHTQISKNKIACGSRHVQTIIPNLKIFTDINFVEIHIL